MDSKIKNDDDNRSLLIQAVEVSEFINRISSYVHPSWYGNKNLDKMQAAMVCMHINYAAIIGFQEQLKKYNWIEKLLLATSEKKDVIIKTIGNWLITNDIKKIVDKNQIEQARIDLGDENFRFIRNGVDVSPHVPGWSHPVIYEGDWKTEGLWRGFSYLVHTLAHVGIKKDQIKILSLFFSKEFWDRFNEELPYVIINEKCFKIINRLIVQNS